MVAGDGFVRQRPRPKTSMTNALQIILPQNADTFPYIFCNFFFKKKKNYWTRPYILYGLVQHYFFGIFANVWEFASILKEDAKQIAGPSHIKVWPGPANFFWANVNCPGKHQHLIIAFLCLMLTLHYSGKRSILKS